MQKNPDPCAEYDELRDISLRKRLEILMMAKYVDRFELANRVGLPLRSLRLILKYKSVILKNWKYCPTLGTHVGLNDLLSIFAANQLLVEWCRRVRRLVSDEDLLRQARYIKRLFNLRYLEVSEDWLEHFKNKWMSGCAAYRNLLPSDVASILEWMKKSLPSRIYDRFQFYLLLERFAKEQDPNAEEHNSVDEDGGIKNAAAHAAEAPATAEKSKNVDEDMRVEVVPAQVPAAAEKSKNVDEDMRVEVVPAQVPAAAEKSKNVDEDMRVEVVPVQVPATDCVVIDDSDSDVEEIIQPIPFFDMVDEDEEAEVQKMRLKISTSTYRIAVAKPKIRTYGRGSAASRAKRRDDSGNASEHINSKVPKLSAARKGDTVINCSTEKNEANAFTHNPKDQTDSSQMYKNMDSNLKISVVRSAPSSVMIGSAFKRLEAWLKVHADRSSSPETELVQAAGSTDVEQESPTTTAESPFTKGESLNSAADTVPDSSVVLVRKKYCLDLDGEDWVDSGTQSQEFSNHNTNELMSHKAVECTADEALTQIEKNDDDEELAEVEEEEANTDADDENETVELFQVIEEDSNDDDINEQEEPNTSTHDSEEDAPKTTIILQDDAAARTYLEKLHRFAVNKLDLPALMLIKQLDAVFGGEHPVNLDEY